MLNVFSDLTVDLRDTLFDIGQANTLKEHAEALTARQAIAESRKSRGFLADFFHRSQDLYKPTYNHVRDGTVCTLLLFVELVFRDLTVMNLSHVITEFSFGKHFPEITQPLDNSFEITHDEFVAYQYYLRVSHTLRTEARPHSRVSGIFFKLGIEPVHLTLIQRTTTLTQFFIRCVGVIGGIFVSTYSGVSSYANSPAGSPMLPYSPYSPATVPPPLSGRTASGGYPGTPSGLGLSPGVFRPVSPGGGIGGGLRTPATAATLGSPAPGLGTPGLGTPSFGHFSPTPRSPLSGFAAPPPPRDTGKKDD
ncbi:hypothetical protein H4582DRAFT_2084239 [Lactarius indigo]|nr:hypothetical protein H4582DRAFT_2084239 [Lactarius indigo]